MVIFGILNLIFKRIIIFMSFTSEVKTEMMENKIKKCCRYALLFGMIYYGGKNNSLRQKNLEIITMAKKLIYSVFGISIEIKEEKGIGGETIYCLDASHLPFDKSIEATKSCCEASLIKGAFLTCGMVSNPNRSYQLEFALENSIKAEAFKEILLNNGINIKQTQRPPQYVLYAKEAESISDMLTLMCAIKGSLCYIETSVEKSVKNRINRSLNCENANMDKSIEAGMKHRKAIRKLKEKGIFETLDQSMKDIAAIREQNPEMNLEQLGQLLKPPLSKSGVYHRLKKLFQLSEES